MLTRRRSAQLLTAGPSAQSSQQASVTKRKRESSTTAAAQTKKAKLEKKQSEEPWLVGAHFSMSGGYHNAVITAHHCNATAFAMDLRNKRQWAAADLTDDKVAKFRKACEEYGFGPSQILPHGSYLMNCASADEELLAKSRAVLVDEMRRCERLGILLYNFHPGSTCGAGSDDEGLDRISESINMAHTQTNGVIAVVENMAGQGNVLGGSFAHLKRIIDRVIDKSRVGICLDTCHLFAFGYDVSSEEQLQAVMDEFDRTVGISYLKAMHLNDSQGELCCKKDRHANLGKGKIGLDCFRAIMQDDRFKGIPLILETPADDDDVYKAEIALLRRFASSS